MTMIDMAGLDWGKGPEGGIYLMPGDTTRAQVGRGGGGMMHNAHLKGWDGARFVPGDVKTSEEALRITGLDWPVQRRPILKVDPILGVGENGVPEIIGWEPQKREGTVERGKRKQVNNLPTGGYDIAEAHVMNVRGDNGAVLGVVGPGWYSPQNREAFSFLDDLIDSGDAKWLGGGEVDGGKRIWLACQFDRDVLIGGDVDERCIPLAFVQNGWDGTLALSITAAPYKLACLNGQTIPLEGHVRTWKARHTAGLSLETRIAEARRTLELSIGFFDAWTDAMNEMITQKVTETEVERAIRLILPDPAPGKDGTVGDRALKNVDAKREAVLTIYRETDNIANIKGTKYGVFNAITEYADWHVKGPLDKQIIRSAEPSKIKDRAREVLVAL